MSLLSRRSRASFVGVALLVGLAVWISPPARADETCMSPYMAKITGQEDFVYVWTPSTPMKEAT